MREVLLFYVTWRWQGLPQQKGVTTVCRISFERNQLSKQRYFCVLQTCGTTHVPFRRLGFSTESALLGSPDVMAAPLLMSLKRAARCCSEGSGPEETGAGFGGGGGGGGAGPPGPEKRRHMPPVSGRYKADHPKPTIFL